VSTRCPFTFGIPLLPRQCASNWARIECLLTLTLTSLLAQTDQDFHIVVAGHDRPVLPKDPRIEFLQVDWPALPQRSDNLDRGRKVFAINDLVMRRGGGLLMFVDADDWIDTQLVEHARALIGGSNAVGGVVVSGYAIDFRTLRTAALPDQNVFPGPFNKICGSSTVAMLRPQERDPLRRDPHTIMHEHYRWTELAQELGAPLVELPVHNAYLINTAENHSELYGPFAAWRREFIAAVNRVGFRADSDFMARFGLNGAEVRAASRRFE